MHPVENLINLKNALTPKKQVALAARAPTSGLNSIKLRKTRKPKNSLAANPTRLPEKTAFL